MLKILREKIGSTVEENVALSKYTWFKIGGPAKYFYVARNNDDLINALKVAEALKLHYFILGGGSNLLVSDDGYDGLVIKPENKNFKIEGTTVYAEAGVSVVDLLRATLEAGLTGWAWAAGLPGTIGGAVRGNAGAYGKGMSDIVTNVEIFQHGAVKTFSNADMQFSYRHSIVKDEPDIILSAQLRLEHGTITAEKEQVKAYEERRVKTQPLDYPNCGCIFKNVDLTEVEIDRKKVMKGLDVTEEEFAQATKFNKLPVSFILDKLNLKGKQIGGAQVSDKHAAFIINVDYAKAEHVVMLISDIKMRVRNELGIQLEEEVQYVGF